MTINRVWLVVLALASPALAGPGWLYYGGDPGGRHYSEAQQISRDNVADSVDGTPVLAWAIGGQGQGYINTSFLIDELIEEKLGTTVVIANPFANMSVSAHVKPQSLSNDAAALMIACGLALRSFD